MKQDEAGSREGGVEKEREKKLFLREGKTGHKADHHGVPHPLRLYTVSKIALLAPPVSLLSLTILLAPIILISVVFFRSIRIAPAGTPKKVTRVRNK